MRQFGRWARLLFVVAASANAAAQIQSPTPPALSADLSRYYFKTPEDEVAARAELNTALDQIARFKGQIDSAAQFLAALRSTMPFEGFLRDMKPTCSCAVLLIARPEPVMPIMR